MILANGCNITKSEKFKGVWILSVPTVYKCSEIKTFLGHDVSGYMGYKAEQADIEPRNFSVQNLPSTGLTNNPAMAIFKPAFI